MRTLHLYWLTRWSSSLFTNLACVMLSVNCLWGNCTSGVPSNYGRAGLSFTNLCELLVFPKMTSTWFVISSQQIHKAGLDCIIYLTGITSTLTCEAGTGRTREVPDRSLDLINQLAAQAFPAPALSALECRFTRIPWNSHFITSPFIRALPSKNIRSQIIMPNQLQTMPGVLACGRNPDRFLRRCVCRAWPTRNRRLGLPSSDGFCLSSFSLKLHMCLAFLRTRTIHGRYLLSENWKYVLI